ncbi:MAG: hypothetical protein FWF51_09640, partial [Chitinivibrionia bacterium]|nr:hypothetical protein [Chitinivibrionia bacterium]
QHSTAQHSTAQHSTAQHSTAQHSTAQHISTYSTSQKNFFFLFFHKFHKKLLSANCGKILLCDNNVTQKIYLFT